MKRCGGTGGDQRGPTGTDGTKSKRNRNTHRRSTLANTNSTQARTRTTAAATISTWQQQRQQQQQQQQQQEDSIGGGGRMRASLVGGPAASGRRPRHAKPPCGWRCLPRLVHSESQFFHDPGNPISPFPAHSNRSNFPDLWEFPISVSVPLGVTPYCLL